LAFAGPKDLKEAKKRQRTPGESLSNLTQALWSRPAGPKKAFRHGSKPKKAKALAGNRKSLGKPKALGKKAFLCTFLRRQRKERMRLFPPMQKKRAQDQRPWSPQYENNLRVETTTY
jgi:hypothetical protein